MYLIDVIVTNASLMINHPFTYYFENDIEKFKRVKVSFSNRNIIALVVDSKYTDLSIDEINKKKGYTLLPINTVIDENPIINEELFELAYWLKRTTISPLISCINLMLPKALRTSKKLLNPTYITYFKKNIGNFKFNEKQKAIYDLLYDGIKASDARKYSEYIIKKLIEIKAIEEYKELKKYHNELVETKNFKKLTLNQKKVYEEFLESDKLVSLLFGITGSGKTEVYLHLTKKYLEEGKEVLILVPEISLTPQMISRVKERFNDVVFYHSALSDQERFEQYQRIKNREVRIVIGTRSAIFLPFNNLGLIIIDEEHDQSYKQDNVPCYHIRNVAIKRAIYHHSKILLASATPSLDSYTRALKNDYQLLKLTNRINECLPEINFVDLNNSIRNKKAHIISNELKSELDDCLGDNKQAIILLNRRGYSPIVKCSNCDEILMCDDCDTALTYHQDLKILKCNTCNKTYPLFENCPNCHKKSLQLFGYGTKKVQEFLMKLYSDKVVERMDRDNISTKGSYAKILDSFGNKEIDILIGTQMIGKGLDYPDVTVVGILNADAGLLRQDFNSSKATFDLLMQASGRAGRSNYSGKVIIQAFNLDHYVLKAVKLQDYDYFYNIEMKYRKAANYPPYSHIVKIIISDTSIDRLNNSVNYLEKEIKQLNMKTYKPLKLAKIEKLSRFQIVILDKNIIEMLKQTNIIIDRYLKEKNMSRVKIDVDPLYLE